MDRRKLVGRVAIVTGASSGVGWLSAVRLAEEGVRLCVTARRSGPLKQLAASLVARGLDCIEVAADVSSQEQVDRVVAACLARYGRVDLLVNDAGVRAYGPFDELPWAEVERIVDVNLLGYLRFARAVLPHFRAQRSGHLVNVLSMLSVGAAPLLSVYAAAEHALLGWADSLRLELRGSGIDVSGVLLPSVSTPMFDHAPMHLGRAPRPIPPVYDTEVAARAVVRCALRPHPRLMPVFLQGRLVTWTRALLPSLAEALLSRFGARLQMGEERVDPDRGNLFAPLPHGVGPYGSVPPTAAWKRLLSGAGVALAAAATLYGAFAGARRVARALR